MEEAKTIFPKSDSRSQKKFILELFRVIGKGAPHLALPALGFLYRESKDEKTQKFVLAAFLEVGELSPAIALPELDKLIGAAPKPLLIKLYGEIGVKEAPLARPKLMAWLDHPELNVSFAALVGLSKLGDIPKVALAKIEAFFDLPETKQKALRMVSRIVKNDQRYTIPLLDRASHDTDGQISSFAKLRRFQIAGGAPRAIQALVEDRQLPVSAAKELLEQMDVSERRLVLDYLKKAFESKDRLKLAKIITLLSEMEVKEMVGVQILIQASFDSSLGLQREAIAALAKSRADEAPHIFLKACQEKQSEIHATALQAMVEMVATANPLLMKQLKASSSHTSPQVRIKALQALTKFVRRGDAEIIKLAESACEDKEEAVRSAAYRLIAAVGESPQEIFLLQHYPQATAAQKVEILRAVEKLGTAEKSLSLLLKECEASSPSLYLAAFKALATLGRASATVILEKLNLILPTMKEVGSIEKLLQTIVALGEGAPQQALKALIYCCNFRELEASSHQGIRQIGIQHLVNFCREQRELIPFLAKFFIQNCLAVQIGENGLTIFDPLNGSRITIGELDSNWIEELQKGHREIFNPAVSQNVEALKFVSDALKSDKEFVLAAVSQNVEALKFVSDALKSDKEFVLAAVSQNVDGKNH